MLINKWVITDSFQAGKQTNWQGGYCFSAGKALEDVSGLYKDLQQLPQDSFSILLNADDSNLAKISDADLEKIIGLFFQPCYYFSNDQPVVFLQRNNTTILSSCEKLIEKGKKQGLNVSILEVKNNYPNRGANQFVYQVGSNDIPYDLLINNWLADCIDNNVTGEIHLLISEKEDDLSNTMDNIVKKEKTLHQSREYKLASLLYEKQELIEDYKRELDLKIAAEKDFQFHMIIQKEQVKENVQWYYNEYEILPGWYKKFGHLIKVLTGKRTLRSLFSDNVKKYKH